MTRRNALLSLAVIGAICVAPGAAPARGLLPGPGDAGHDAELEEKIEGYHRVIHGLLTLPFGWGLEAFVSDPAARSLIQEFVSSGEHDFEAATGSHPYEVLDYYFEIEDVGMFGGVQTAGDVLRYAVLRDSGSDAQELDRARARLLRALDGLHWYHQITGVPGVVARACSASCRSRAIPAPR